MNSYIEIEGVGQVAVRISARAKRIKLGVKTDGSVLLVLPAQSKSNNAEIKKFITDHIDWIQKQQAKYASRFSQTIFTPDTKFHTFSHRLNIIVSDSVKTGEAAIFANEMKIVIPSHLEMTSERVQNFIRQVIEEAMRKEGKAYLPKLTKELAAKHGLKCNQITIKKVKTRWGSCSSQKNINFNLHLMRLPEELRRYVVLHELAHTVEMNHSSKFWALLESICPNAKKLDKELSQYSSQVY